MCDRLARQRMDDPLRPWPKLGSRRGDSLVLFRPRWDTLQNPRTEEILQRLVLEAPDWVNVVALTEERRLVCVRQYRFGTGGITLEIPGGSHAITVSHPEAVAHQILEAAALHVAA